jgi:HPr kinase/phosphorylase
MGNVIRQAASLSSVIGSQCGSMHSQRHMHGSCVSRADDAILMIGPSGSGKSDLVLRLLSRGFELVADDQVDIADGFASCPINLAGLLEVRGLGIVRLPYRARARLALVIDLGWRDDRLPFPRQHRDLLLPVVGIDPQAASAPERVAMALDCALGRVPQIAGAFAT